MYRNYEVSFHDYYRWQKQAIEAIIKTERMEKEDKERVIENIKNDNFSELMPYMRELDLQNVVYFLQKLILEKDKIDKSTQAELAKLIGCSPVATLVQLYVVKKHVEANNDPFDKNAFIEYLLDKLKKEIEDSITLYGINDQDQVARCIDTFINYLGIVDINKRNELENELYTLMQQDTYFKEEVNTLPHFKGSEESFKSFLDAVTLDNADKYLTDFLPKIESMFNTRTMFGASNFRKQKEDFNTRIVEHIRQKFGNRVATYFEQDLSSPRVSRLTRENNATTSTPERVSRRTNIVVTLDTKQHHLPEIAAALAQNNLIDINGNNIALQLGFINNMLLKQTDTANSGFKVKESHLVYKFAMLGDIDNTQTREFLLMPLVDGKFCFVELDMVLIHGKDRGHIDTTNILESALYKAAFKKCITECTEKFGKNKIKDVKYQINYPSRSSRNNTATVR